MKNKPKAVVFDWDDTLADNWISIHSALNAALSAMGHRSWSFDKTRTNVRRSLREIFPELFGEHWEEAADIFYKHIQQNHLQSLKPQSFAQELLEQLKGAEIILGIVSNKTGHLLRAECNHLGWSNYFFKVIGANDAAKDKPAADPLYLCLKGSNINVNYDVWFVGDSPSDLECAKNTGVVGVVVRDTALTRDYQEFSPRFHFKNLREMADFLL